MSPPRDDHSCVVCVLSASKRAGTAVHITHKCARAKRGQNNLLEDPSSLCSYHFAVKMSARPAAATHSACELCIHYLTLPYIRRRAARGKLGPFISLPLPRWGTCCYSNCSQAAALSLPHITRDAEWGKLQLK